MLVFSMIASKKNSDQRFDLHSTLKEEEADIKQLNRYHHCACVCCADGMGQLSMIFLLWAGIKCNSLTLPCAAVARQLWAFARKGFETHQGMFWTSKTSLLPEVDRVLREGAEIDSTDSVIACSPSLPPPPGYQHHVYRVCDVSLFFVAVRVGKLRQASALSSNCFTPGW